MVKVLLVEGPNGGKFPFSNCLLVEGDGVRVLVDTGCYPNLPEGFFDAVVYTHFHPDHIRGFEAVAGRAGRVFAPRGEEPYRSLKDLAVRFAPGIVGDWLAMAEVIGLSGVPRADEYYEPGEDLCVKSLCMRTYPARGHLLTHTLIEVDGHLHLVDIDLTGFGPWYANPEASPSLFLDDIEMAAGLEARNYTTAHKQGVLARGEAASMLARYAERLIGHAEAVYKLLGEEPKTPQDLTGSGAIYRRYIPGFERVMSYFEAMMIEKVLPLLSLWGCARRARRGWVRRECSLEPIREGVRDRILSHI